MSTVIRAGLLLAALLCLTACGTLIGRSEPTAIESKYYKGTQGNLMLLGLHNTNKEANGATVACWIMVVCPIITLASLPIDVSIDTLLVPYDTFNYKN
ncbi:YceK/YidQ family lipoprotein [Stutzerimonas stutzeri]|uniref:YceK/YidQ family lipoprotein n=1 Tax=Stutzerimonas stutzeri TaxID=316 RepID=UPI0005361298|nr:YceK/YidQ family lipoprotein [Stutzerimonas stutzeri]MCQ4284164.1 YceK/YidQ family lipoprotein [Stutzerimonas stutzeri]BAP77188.1 hypothetical protein MT1_0012 [Pseudomonas sp. MT-1]